MCLLFISYGYICYSYHMDITNTMHSCTKLIPCTNLKCNCILGDGDSIVCVPLWLKHLNKFRQDMKKEPCLLVSNGSKLKELKYLLARDAPEYMEEFNREIDKCLREKIYINVGNTDGREVTVVSGLSYYTNTQR